MALVNANISKATHLSRKLVFYSFPLNEINFRAIPSDFMAALLLLSMIVNKSVLSSIFPHSSARKTIHHNGIARLLKSNKSKYFLVVLNRITIQFGSIRDFSLFFIDKSIRFIAHLFIQLVHMLCNENTTELIRKTNANRFFIVDFEVLFCPTLGVLHASNRNAHRIL